MGQIPFTIIRTLTDQAMQHYTSAQIILFCDGGCVFEGKTQIPTDELAGAIFTLFSKRLDHEAALLKSTDVATKDNGTKTPYTETITFSTEQESSGGEPSTRKYELMIMYYNLE